MNKLIAIIENHFWYPVALAYLGLMAFALGLLFGIIVV
jgi:hypothetical protein